MVHPMDMAQINRIRNIAVFFVNGVALNPLTITLYRSKAMKTMVQIEAHPHSEPNMP